jgi:hypothetical protein
MLNQDVSAIAEEGYLSVAPLFCQPWCIVEMKQSERERGSEPLSVCQAQ